jgi:hypothetical protein
MSECLRRAFPFRTDMRAIHYNPELAIVQIYLGDSLDAKLARSLVHLRSPIPSTTKVSAAAKQQA